MGGSVWVKILPGKVKQRMKTLFENTVIRERESNSVWAQLYWKKEKKKKRRTGEFVRVSVGGIIGYPICSLALFKGQVNFLSSTWWKVIL